MFKPCHRPGDKRIAALKTGEDVRALFKEVFPAFLPAVREVDLERFAHKGDSSLPTFSYAGPVLHHGQSTCLVGDAIHTGEQGQASGVRRAGSERGQAREWVQTSIGFVDGEPA